MALEDTFRQDLLYRINTVEIELPPLREREEDIPVLAAHFLNLYSKKYKKRFNKLSAAVIKKLSSYQWPGNVREFQHVFERTVIMSEGNTLHDSDFHLTSQPAASEGFEFDSYNLEDIEKTIIEKVLRSNRGNVSKAASDLGLTRTSLYRRLEKHGL